MWSDNPRFLCKKNIPEVVWRLEIGANIGH